MASRNLNVNAGTGLSIFAGIFAGGAVLLWVLHGGPTTSQVASGSLTGQTSRIATTSVTTTRASNKTCATGSTQDVNQLISDPEQIGNLVDWSVINSVIAAPTVTLNTTDVVAPDGSSTATKAVFPASTATGQYSMVFNNRLSGSGGFKTFSVYVLGATASQTFYIGTDGSPTYSVCNINNTTWTRCVVTQNAGANYAEIGTDTRVGNGNMPLMAAQTVYLWGAKAESGTSATAYNTSGTSFNNQQLLILGSSKPCTDNVGLSVESAATNLLTNSANGATGTNCIFTSPVAPDGTLQSQLCTDQNVNAEHRYNLAGGAAVAVSNGAYTLSVYVRAGTYHYLSLWNSGTTSAVYNTFDVSTGSVVATAGASAGAVTATLTGGWYRIASTWTLTAGSYNFYISIGDTLAHAVPGTAYTGSSGTVTAWGAQLETGSFPTSYIATTSSAATRAADKVSAAIPSGFSGTMGSASLTYRPAFTGNEPVNSGALFYFDTKAALYEAAGTQNLFTFDGTHTSSIASTLTAGSPLHAGVQWGGGVFQVFNYTDGTSGASSAFSGWGSPATLYLGNDNSANFANGWLTDVCLASTTTGCK